MADPHLNLFYSYNHDNELIENNLTRAWIVTMRLLSPPTRTQLLEAVLAEAHRQNPLAGEAPLTFAQAEFALQGHMRKALCAAIPHRYVLAIATERYEESQTEDQHPHTYESIPDAWIYDQPAGWLYLVEAKVGANPLDDQQLRSHAKAWLGLASRHELEAHLLSLSWFDILAAIEGLRRGEGEGPALDAYDDGLLAEFLGYLGWFGYHLFKGFDWAKLREPPEYEFALSRRKRARMPSFDRLREPPHFRINVD